MIKGEVVTALMSKIMRVILTGVSMIAIIMEACSPGQSTDAIENSTVSRKCALKTEAKAMMEVPLPEEYLIDNFEITYQMPELPTGCEITALTMALNYYGYGIDKVTMAAQYLPTAAANLYYGADGTLYGSDLNQYFIGDPATEFGYVCGTGAIVTAADSYLSETGSELRAKDMTGTEPEELYEMVSEDIPVVVWVTIGMADRQPAQGWYTENGEYVDWSTNDHGAVLIGYSEDTVTIADPISGLTEYSRGQFESVFESRGRQCEILQ